jgi:hypothetical protein
MCHPQWEQCGVNNTCQLTGEAPAANLCAGAGMAGDRTFRNVGCRIGAACVTFNTAQSASSPCLVSSQPGTWSSPLSPCTGQWEVKRGLGVCDCTATPFVQPESSSRNSLGLDFARARFSRALPNFAKLNFTDASGNGWLLPFHK